MKKVIIGLGVVLLLLIVLTIIFTQKNKQSTSEKLPGKTIADTPAPSKTGPRTFIMYAKNWQFLPNVIIVKKGDSVELRVKSLDVQHGIILPAFDINAKLDPFKTVVLNFTADKTGSFEYSCTVNCGPQGYTGMKGTVIVE